jgi:L-arabinose isomerase
MLANHGIHGLQDLASVLRRAGRDYTIAAGPLDSPRLWHRVTAWMRAAQARHLLRRLRVAQIGEAFAGMGDFDVSPEFLREKVGPERVAIEIGRIGELCGQVTPAGLAAEKAADAQAFDTAGCRDECLDRANRVGLALRRALEAEGAEAFSMNFASFDRSRGTPTVPFLEASKALARGIGYAGEGDVLTASLVAALQCYAPTTFTEMFCPDWSGGRIFMSHMGECNPALAKGRPRIVEKDFSFGAADNPAVLVFALRPGPAALVNLAPRRDSLALIAADVEIADAELEPGLPGMPHFWIVPRAGDVAAFLETYSEAGGTHHLALTPGLRASDLRDLARALNWDFVLLD